MVPRSVEVDLSGYSILGSLEHRVQAEPLHQRILNWLRGDRSSRGADESGAKLAAGAAPDAAAVATTTDAPPPEPVVLVIRGFAILGNVSIKRV